VHLDDFVNRHVLSPLDVRALQAGPPASTHSRKTAICSSDQAPSQGIVPSRRRSRSPAPPEGS
jgi:hypothetical protein